MNKEIINIVFEENNHRSAAYINDALVGTCTYELSSDKWAITHTVVDPSFGGRGIAKQLVESLINEARKRKIKIIPICSYAYKMMMGKKEYEDVL